jgi:hypothetical protein
MTWLHRLRDATTLPPETDDVDVLLAAFAQVSAAREAILAQATPLRIAGERGEVYADLQNREAAWRTTLATARHRVAAHRIAASQAQRYR